MSRVDILIEAGFEEIPHRFIPDIVAELRSRFEKLLQEAALDAARVRVDATPRRLVVRLEDCAARQADRSEELVGPPKEQAYKDGVPTKAAEGFARKAGVEVEALRVAVTDKGERVVALREVEGRSVEEVLGERAPALFETLPWPKNMRWGDGRRASVRPIHWVVALAGDRVFGVEIFGIASGRMSRGHRTMFREPLRIESVASHEEQLRSAFVIVSRDERRAIIREGLATAAAQLGATLQEDDGLVESCCDLVEWPVVVAGEFPVRYLELPGIVLSTAMRHHQKFFTLTDAKGALLPRFLHVAGKDDPTGSVARNNGGVLIARLDDATFYWNADLERPMASRLDELSRVLFQEKLGSYLEKVRRMERLSVQVAMLLDPVDWSEDREVQVLVQAVEMCKVDQTTHVVKEFTELQGIMGSIYLRREGFPEPACAAIEEHYLPQALTDPVPATRLGALLSIIDKADTLAGCFGVGVIPTGSKDPFGLRRAAQGLVRTLLECRIDVSLPALLQACADQYSDVAGFAPASMQAELRPYLRERLRFVLTEGVALGEGGTFYPQDEVDAVLGASWERLPDVLERLSALHSVRHAGRRDDFEALSVAFKRVRNILKGQPAHALDAKALKEPAELALAEAVTALRRASHASRSAELEALATLRPHVDLFFEKVMVMADDAALRSARLALLQEIERLFLAVADISQIVVAARE